MHLLCNESVGLKATEVDNWSVSEGLAVTGLGLAQGKRLQPQANTRLTRHPLLRRIANKFRYGEDTWNGTLDSFHFTFLWLLS